MEQDKKILIVEDEWFIAQDTKGRVENLGYSVCGIAATGEDAVRQAAEMRPDLILMDIKLKGEMDGIAAAERIKAEQDIPVVYVTAFANRDLLERVKTTGPYGYILKPFKEEALHTAVEIAFYKHQMEKKVRESEERFRAIFESTGDLVFLKDRDLRYIEANRSMENFFGMSGGNLADVTDEALFGQEAAAHIRETDTRVLAGETVEEEDTRPVGGEKRTFHIIKTPVREKDNEVTGLCGIARDITDMRKAQAAEIKTVQYESMFKTVAAVCHNLNQPLQVLTSALDILEDDVNHDLIGEIRKSVMHIGDITRKLQGIVKYRTKAHIDGSEILDIDESSRQ